MTESVGNLDEARARLDDAEQQDDATRLQALEELHAELEAELERDAPRADTAPGS